MRLSHDLLVLFLAPLVTEIFSEYSLVRAAAFP
jgi:hypothetical protein